MFVIDVPYINLNQIYNSWQAPRWIKLKEDKYIIPHNDKVLKIEQQKTRLIMSCSEDDFYNVWFNYFDLKTDYFILNDKVRRISKKFKIVANRGSGIHILNQNPFEAYIFSKLVANVGYAKAHVAINHIAQVCGIEHKQSMREAGRITWYEFPTPEMILEKFDKLKKMGKVNAWLKKLCEAIVTKGYDFENNGNDLFSLYSGKDKNEFPLYEIEDTLAKNFSCDVEEFADLYLEKIENKGLVYMYILHHKLNPPKDVKHNGTR